MRKSLKKKLIAIVCGAMAAFSVGGLAACDELPVDPPPGAEEPTGPVKLVKPVIMRNGNVVSWSMVDNATGYHYKINGGAEQFTTTLSVTLQKGQYCQVKAVGDGEDYLDSVWSNIVTYTLETLDRPIVSLTDNIASWPMDANASGYVYTINGGDLQLATSNSVPLQNGQSIRVQALGDGVSFEDSLFSSTVRYIEETKYTISATLDIAGAGVIDGVGAYGENASVDLIATANEGYIFDGWYLNGVKVSTSSIYTIAQLTQDVELVTKWKKKTYAMTAVSEDVAKGVVSGSATYEHGDDVTFTATPDADYTFIGWFDGELKVSDDAVYTFTATKATTLTAKFAANFCIVTLTAETGGTVSGGGKCALDLPTTVRAEEAEGYTFIGWYENGNKVSDDLQYTFTATQDRGLTAKFTINSYTIAVSAAANGTVSGGGTFTHGMSVTLTATPDEGYDFDGWYEGNNKVSTDAVYTFPAKANKTLTAKFAIKTYTIAVEAFGGSVVGDGKFDHGTSVTLTATANEGYTFDGWYENEVEIETGTQFTFTATADRTLQARFTPDVCKVTLTATAGGTVSGDGDYNYGAQVSVHATTNEGYTFEGWYEGSTQVSDSLTYTFTAENHVELQARWTINSYTLTLEMDPEDVGTVSGGGTYTYGKNSTILAETTNSSYIFKGWYEDGELVSPNESYNLTVTGDRTLEARWEFSACVLTLVSDFDIAGELTGAGTYGCNQTVTLRAAQRENYTFLGWYDEQGLLSTEPSHVYKITEDVTITGKWQDDWVNVTTSTALGYDHKGYAYYTMKQHANDVMPIVGFNSPNAATNEFPADVYALVGYIESQITDQNYQMMKDAGINTIVGWWNDWTNGGLQDDILKDMDLAEKYGISYIVNDRNGLKVKNAAQFEDDAFRYMRKPAYGGTILIDEPGAVNFADIATATRAWEASEYNDTLAYVNMLPNYASSGQLYDAQGTGGSYNGPSYSGYQQWLQRYLEITQPEVCSYDYYPYRFTQPTYFGEGWYGNMSNVRFWSAAHGVPFWVYGQLGGWPEYGQTISASTKHLTFGHTALQFNSMLSYGAKGIQYYNYFMPPNYAYNSKDYTSATMADGTPTPFYDHIKRINKQVVAVDDVLMRCAWKGIIQLNWSPAEISSGDLVSNYAALTSASASGNAIVGCFEYRDIGWAYYVTTNDVYYESTVTLNFDGNYNLRKVQNGESTTVSGNSITMTIDAGDGVLVVVPKN